MLDQQAAKIVKEVQAVSDRLLIVRLKSEPVDLNIIVVYMPTSAYEDEDVGEIHEQMEERIRALPSKEYTALLEDMNAIVGEGREGTVVGPHGLIETNKTRKGRTSLKRTRQGKQRTTWKREKNVRKEFIKVAWNRMKSFSVEAKGVEKKWQQLKDSMIHGAEKAIGVNKRKRSKKPWLIAEMIDKMEEGKGKLLGMKKVEESIDGCEGK